MKKVILILAFFPLVTLIKAQVSKTVNVATAGTLSTLLTSTEKSTVTELTVTGNINSIDIYTISSSMPNVETVDLEQSTLASGAKIEFYYHEKLKAIKLPQTVQVISFNGCHSLASIDIPPFVQNLDTSFSKCRNLKMLRIPAAVKLIDGRGFVSSGISEFIVDSSNVTFSSKDGIVYSKDLETLVVYPPQKYGQYRIPQNIKSIQNDAFLAVDSLTSIVIPSTVSFNLDALNLCHSMQEFIVEAGNPRYTSLDGVLYSKEMDSLLAYPASKYGDFVVPASVRYIGASAFSGSRYLHSITLNKSTVSPSIQSLFNDCGNLTSITVENGNPRYASANGMLCNMNKDTLFFCPRAKSGLCQIPQGVTTIYNNAFSQCNIITSLVLPSSIKKMYDYAFSSSTSLSSIRSYINPPISVTSNVFPYSIKNTCVLYVPQGTKSAYQATTGWTGFKNIVETTTFRLSSDSLHFTSKSGNTSIRILSDTTWTAKTDQTWLTVSPDSVTMNNTDTSIVSVSVLSNKGLFRQGYITLLSVNGVQKRIPVSQEGDSVLLTVKPISVQLSSDSASMDTIVLTSGSAWTSTQDQAWFSVSHSSGAAGTTSLVFKSLSANISSISREAHFTIKSGTSSKELLVTQEGTPDFISLSDSALVFRSFQYYDTVKVLSKSSWKVTNVDSSWVIVSQGKDNLVIQCKPNNGSSSRTTVLTISTSAGSVAHLYIKQEFDPKKLIVSPDSVVLTPDSASYKSVYINSNSHWTASVDKPWIRLSTTSGDGSLSLKIQAIEQNISDAQRGAIITISADTITRTIRVVQSKCEITVGSFDTKFSYQSGISRTVKIASNTMWVASSNQSWLQVSPVSGTGATTITLTTKSENDSFFSERSATVQITAGNVVKTFTIKQGASTPEISGGDTLHSCQDSAILMCTNKLATHKYLWNNGSNTNKTTVHSPGWYSVTVSNANNETVKDSIFVMFDTTLDFNTMYKSSDSLSVSFTPSFSRVDSLIWSFGDGGSSKLLSPEHKYKTPGTYTVNLVLTSEYSCQLHKTKSIKVGTLFDISSLAVQLSSDSASRDTVFLTSGSAWTSTQDQTWFSVSPSSGAAGTTSLVFKSLSANTSSVSREAKVSITSSSVTKSIRVVQDPILGVSDDTLKFSFYRSYDSLQVTTSLPWVANVADSSWMSVRREVNTLFIDCEQNTSQSSRSTIITISTSTGITQKVMIVQLGKQQTSLLVASFDTTFAADSGLMKWVRITSNTSWTASSDQPWLSVDPRGQGNDSIILKTVLANDLFKNRVATLQISDGSVVKKFNILQKAYVPTIAQEDTVFVCNNTVSLSINGPSSASYLWSNGATGRQVTESVHQYGRYSVTMTDVKNNIMTDSIFVMAMPAVTILSSITSNDSFSVNFKAIGSGNDAMNWSFGDGTTSALKEPQHIYSKAGMYIIRLNVTSNNGCSRNASDSIRIDQTIGVCKAAFSTQINKATHTVEFINLSKNADEYTWNFGDNSAMSNQASATHTYSSAGNYRVRLMVINKFGCRDTLFQFVTIDSLIGIQSSFNFIFVDSVTFKFTATGIGFDKAFWTFGDGTTATGTTVQHRFAKAGKYNVCLNVINNKTGQTSQTCQTVNIGKIPCNISAAFSSSVTDKTVRFTLNSPDSSLTYSWSFGDKKTSSVANPTHIYGSSGLYLVSLSVRNTKTGCVDYFADFVQVGTVGCKASFSTFVNVDSLKLLCSNTSSGDDLHYYWSFGDGTCSSEKSPTKKYGHSGLYNVNLVVSNGGCTNYVSQQVQVGAFDCSSDFTVFVDSARQTAYFESRPIGDVTKYFWMFGDGNTSSKSFDSHTYRQPGYYNVSLNTYNQANNCVDTRQKTILVSNDLNDCEADFYYLATGQNIQFFDKSSGVVKTRIWDFGDKDKSTSINPVHQFTSSGYRDVCLTITNARGNTNTTCKSIPVLVNDTNMCKARMEWSIIDTLTHELLYIDRSNGNINKITWSIDDSGKVYSTNYKHRFVDTGLYIIKHEVMDSVLGCYDREYNLTSITNNSTDNGLKTAFVVETKVLRTKSTQSSFQFYGLTTLKPARYLWDFGDGTTDSTSISPLHAYSTPGTYHVCLSVADATAGLFDSYCSDVLIAADPVTAIEKRDTVQKTLVISPNPCNEYTSIHYSLSRAGHTQINIFSIDGTLIQQLVNTTKQIGDQTIIFDTSHLVSGCYYVDLLIDGNDHRSMMLVKK